MDSYTKRIERFIDKVNDSVACIASHYALCIRAKEEEKEPPVAEEIAYDAPKTVPNTTYVHSNEVEISPVSINIGPTVERAVERAIAELSDALDKRISETLSTVELPAGNTADAAAVLDAAERVSTAAKALSEVLADQVEKIVTGSSLKLVDEAKTGTKTSTSAAKMTLIGAFVGFGLGCIIVILLELLNNKIYNNEYLTQTYGIPVLASISDADALSGKGFKYYGRKKYYRSYKA